MIKRIKKRDGLMVNFEPQKIAKAIGKEAKSYLGVADDLKLSVNAVEVLKKRYLRRDERGLVAETPGEMFGRVAAHVSRAEIRYGGDAEYYRSRFLKMMRDLDFLPNSPTLMNAGCRSASCRPVSFFLWRTRCPAFLTP